MKFILFVEGHTENKAISTFLKRWLDPKLSQPVGIQTVRFDGWAELVKDSPTKAELHLKRNDVIAVIALLDLYGPTFYPPHAKTADERYAWAKKDLEKKVGQPKFFQFFAVHEIEAWLLSDPFIFPNPVQRSVQAISQSPETVNSTNPPAKRLADIYKKEIKRKYKKVVFGKDLFSRLDPNLAYRKCPRLKQLLDEVLRLAKESLPE